MLGLLTLTWLTSMLGHALPAYDLPGWLALGGAQFWSGQIWRLATYPLVSAGILDLIMNNLALVILGGLLERHWSRGEFWVYCLVAATGAGLAKVALPWSSSSPLTGAAPVMFGLLIAWGFLCGREAITLFLLGEITVWKLVLIAGAISIMTLLFTAGLIPALILTGGGLTGFLYLWCKHQWQMSRPGSMVHSERIHRLEL